MTDERKALSQAEILQRIGFTPAQVQWIESRNIPELLDVVASRYPGFGDFSSGIASESTQCTPGQFLEILAARNDIESIGKVLHFAEGLLGEGFNAAQAKKILSTSGEDVWQEISEDGVSEQLKKLGFDRDAQVDRLVPLGVDAISAIRLYGGALKEKLHWTNDKLISEADQPHGDTILYENYMAVMARYGTT